MPRRPHKKSRSGCVECKRRHIKCDENRPECVNCVTASSSCSFREDQSAQSTPKPATTPTRSLQPERSKPWTPSSSIPIPASDPHLNLEHLEFLHHFCTNTYATFTDDLRQQQVWQVTAVRYGLAYPFLLYEMLALSALHLAHCNPSRRDHYSTKAIELQSSAMQGFNTVQRQVDADNCGAMLMFSSLLAMHVLADPTRTRGLDFNEYLDHLLACIRLMRSVRVLVIKDWWEHLKVQPELQPLFDISLPDQPYNIPQELRQLDNLTQNTDLSDTARSAYDAAIERLHWIFALSDVTRQYSTVRHLLAWPIQLQDGYLELMNERRPEALIILAHYAVLLHMHRDSWVVEDAGVFLITAINAHVGRYWEKWMAWPNQAVGLTGKTPQITP